MSAPRLVATDLDGTLLGAEGVLSARSAQVLAELDARSVPVVIVTGRPLRWIDELLEHVGGHGLAIVSNGALVWDVAADAAFLERPLDVETARGVCADLRAAVPGTSYAVESRAGIGLEPEFAERYPKPPDSRRGPVHELLDAPVLKILARHEELSPDAFWQQAVDAVGERATVTFSTSRSALLEISAAGVTKATTLALVCAHLGVEAADVVAFGDMPNDLAMLTWAGTSYAMADAHPLVTAAADHIAPGHDDDGVAAVLSGLYGL